MKALIQRVKRASVSIEGKLYSSISSGLLVFLGVEKDDEKVNAEKLAQKVINLRVFEDENDKMNLSLKDVKGEMLVVSQFTLCGDCKRWSCNPLGRKIILPVAKIFNSCYNINIKLELEIDFF